MIAVFHDESERVRGSNRSHGTSRSLALIVKDSNQINNSRGSSHSLALIVKDSNQMNNSRGSSHSLALIVRDGDVGAMVRHRGHNRKSQAKVLPALPSGREHGLNITIPFSRPASSSPLMLPSPCSDFWQPLPLRSGPSVISIVASIVCFLFALSLKLQQVGPHRCPMVECTDKTHNIMQAKIADDKDQENTPQSACEYPVCSDLEACNPGSESTELTATSLEHDSLARSEDKDGAATDITLSTVQIDEEAEDDDVIDDEELKAIE